MHIHRNTIQFITILLQYPTEEITLAAGQINAGIRQALAQSHLIDIFIMSSVSEPFGLTALEAAHHDTALLISKQSGVGEVLHNIMRFDYWDVDKLADEIVNIARSPGLQSALKRNVKDEYARLSWRDAAERCVALYQASAERRWV